MSEVAIDRYGRRITPARRAAMAANAVKARAALQAKLAADPAFRAELTKRSIRGRTNTQRALARIWSEPPARTPAPHVDQEASAQATSGAFEPDVAAQAEAENAAAAKRDAAIARLDAIGLEPLAASLEQIIAWAAARGLTFQSWDDLRAINLVRERRRLRPLCRLWPRCGRAGRV